MDSINRPWLTHTHRRTSTSGESISLEFDKYKSWYKIDLDGEFITKYNDPPIRRRILKIRRKKPIVVEDLPYKETVKVEPEKVLIKHNIVTRMGVRMFLVTTFVLAGYFGYIYINFDSTKDYIYGVF